MSKKPLGPVVFDLEEPDVEQPEAAPEPIDAPKAKAKAKAKPKPKPRAKPKAKAAPSPKVEIIEEPIDPSSAPMIMDDEPAPKGEAMVSATRLVTRKFSWIAKLFWGALISLLLMYLTTAAWDFGADLLTRNVWLGRAAILFGAVLLFTLLVVAFKEFAGFARLSRIDAYRKHAEALRVTPDEKKIGIYSRKLRRFYASRSDMKWAIENLKKQDDTIIDPLGVLDLTEVELMSPLDKAARREIETSARMVAGATAIVPLAFADVFVALTANIRMVRQIAEIYGGRAGTLGSWRLMRAVATHLIATGAVGVADDMIGTVAGGGLAGKLSRRFGEGIINGALTARVGLAAMDVCRPMPFAARARPTVASIVQTSLTGMFSKGGA